MSLRLSQLGTKLCLSTLYTGCIVRCRCGRTAGRLCLSTLYTGCIQLREILNKPIGSFASAHSIQVASWLFLSWFILLFFASAHSIQVASLAVFVLVYFIVLCLSTLYTGCISISGYKVASITLCLSTLYTGCINKCHTMQQYVKALPQHTLYRLHLSNSKTSSVSLTFASAHSIQVASTTYNLITTPWDFASAHSIQVASSKEQPGEPKKVFASAHSIQVASHHIIAMSSKRPFASAHSIQVASLYKKKKKTIYLCLSTLYTGCIEWAEERRQTFCSLPQHTLYRLHQSNQRDQKRHNIFASAHSIQVASTKNHDQKEHRHFASAHSIQVASQAYRWGLGIWQLCLSTLYTGCITKDCLPSCRWRLCLSTLYTGCISSRALKSSVIVSLPQHTLYRLHQQ